MSEIGNLADFSATPNSGNEKIYHDVYELYGNYYLVVAGHTTAISGNPFTLNLSIIPPAVLYDPAVTTPIPTNYTTPTTDLNKNTLILVDPARFNRFYGANVFSNSGLADKINQLASDFNVVNDSVNGVVVDLDAATTDTGKQPIHDAYVEWDKPENQNNPQYANFVARNIKALLYKLVPAYPNLKYMVIIGDDRMIPARRTVDEALYANERLYRDVPRTNPIGSALEQRYFLSDDYYAAFLPLEFKARELYLPQLGVGRLVESPSDIVMSIDTFLGLPGRTVTPNSALVTGYSFLTQQANDINAKLHNFGIAAPDTLINDSWTAKQFRASFFGPSVARGLNSLNSHFAHNRFFPNDPTNVYADEVTKSKTDFRNSIIFSVGCHSGLNAPDPYFADLPNKLRNSPDWPQAFGGRGASMIGNTGFGYADSDLILYSSRLMVDFVEQLGVLDGEAPPTTGRALMLAKQQYLNSLAADSLSNYDEKVLGEMLLYGLPMLKIKLPGLPNQPEPPAPPSDLHQSPTFSYTANVQNDNLGKKRGTYYTITGESDFYTAVGAPIEPRRVIPLSLPNNAIAHGVLMLGGTFSDTPNFDPVVTRVVSDFVKLDKDPDFPFTQLYPVQVASVNRFLSIDGTFKQQLVIVPGQFKADSNTAPTRGVQRLYSGLNLEVLTPPKDTGDFNAPSISSIETLNLAAGLQFRVRVGDESGAVTRVVVLYLPAGSTTWKSLELTYDPNTGFAEGTASAEGGPVTYLIQAADAAGNVALALDHGNPFLASFVAPLS